MAMPLYLVHTRNKRTLTYRTLLPHTFASTVHYVRCGVVVYTYTLPHSTPHIIMKNNKHRTVIPWQFSIKLHSSQYSTNMYVDVYGGLLLPSYIHTLLCHRHHHHRRRQKSGECTLLQHIFFLFLSQRARVFKLCADTQFNAAYVGYACGIFLTQNLRKKKTNILWICS